MLQRYLNRNLSFRLLEKNRSSINSRSKAKVQFMSEAENKERSSIWCFAKQASTAVAQCCQQCVMRKLLLELSARQADPMTTLRNRSVKHSR
ncbi:hypothetical protein Zmor_012098 [Zophobas morio]|uniref:Uncharacterized protein n=1 Tax=Zophobas morio TaxID=2755281 RepID=A0AA38HHC2_9CUCU|nr:hypothetical protein Zmor_012098 [Zophobas morio]